MAMAMAVDLEDPAALIAADVDANPSTVVTAEPDEKSTARHLFEPAYCICMFILVSALLVFFSSLMDPDPSVIGYIAYALGVAGLVIGPCACVALFVHYLTGNMDGNEQIELLQDRSR